jgi:hypothetical protein
MNSIWAVKIRSKNADDLLDLIFNEHLDVSCGGPCKSVDGFFETVAYLSDEKKDQLINRRSDSIKTEILEDMIKTGIERQKDISSANRFRNSQSTYHGVGIKE